MNKIILFTLLLWQGVWVNACDICGCNSASNYFGILPKFQQSFTGFRYQTQSYQSRDHHSESQSTGIGSETFSSVELWGRYVLSHRVQLFGFVPYKSNSRIENSKTTSVNGLGDVSFIVNYVLLNKEDSVLHFKQLLQLGGGVKLPTGEHELIKSGLMLHPNMQPGSGSFDFPFNLNYTIRRNYLGFNTELAYSKNLANNQKFQFGDKFSSSLRLFLWRPLFNSIFLPSVGASFEHTAADRVENVSQPYSGGRIFMMQSGFDIYFKQLAFGFMYRKPMVQNLNDGFVTSKPKITTSLIFLF